MFACVNPAQICSWNQPVLSNDNKVSCLWKQYQALMGGRTNN